MKQVLFGGFTAIIGSIWSMAIMLFLSTHIPSYAKAPLISALKNYNMLVLFILAVATVIVGMIIMFMSFKNDSLND